VTPVKTVSLPRLDGFGHLGQKESPLLSEMAEAIHANIPRLTSIVGPIPRLC